MGRLSLNNTPLITVVVPLIIGIVIGVESKIGNTQWWVGASALVVTILLGTIFRKKIGFTLTLFGLAGFWLGFVSIDNCNIKYDERINIVAQCKGDGTVRGKWQTFDAQIVSYCDSTSTWHHSVAYNIKLSIDTSIRKLEAGTIIGARSRLRKMEGSYGENLRKRGIVGRFYGYNVSILGHNSSPFYSFTNIINHYRDKISARIAAIDTVAIGSTAVIAALTVGDKSSMPLQVTQAYRRAGTSHLLAISGLHVGIIFAILNFIFGSVRILPRGQLIFGLLVIILLWTYTIFSGMSPATIRAAIMFTMFQIALMSSFEATSLNILCFSALILLLINPLYIYDVGFLLSYVAMIGISLLYAPIASLIKVKSKILRALWSVTAISIAAQVAVAPLVAYIFGQLPLCGIIVNIAVWITVPAIIICAMLFLATNITLIGSLALYITDFQNSIIAYTASKSWVAIENITISKWSVVVIYIFLIAISIYINNLYYSKLRKKVKQVGYNVQPL